MVALNWLVNDQPLNMKDQARRHALSFPPQFMHPCLSFMYLLIYSFDQPQPTIHRIHQQSN